MDRHIYLRALVHRLTVTSVSSEKASAVVFVCPRICWAMAIEELERVEVFNVRTRGRFQAAVLFGEKEQFEVGSAFGLCAAVGDEVIVSTYLAGPANDDAERAGTIVWARNNRPLEIRRVTARRVRHDPSYVPLPARRERMVPA